MVKEHLKFLIHSLLGEGRYLDIDDCPIPRKATTINELTKLSLQLSQ